MFKGYNDSNCLKVGKTVQTMEGYLYTYFDQKLMGNRAQVVEWIISLINSVCLYKSQDHNILLFAKILKNECDEEFFKVQEQVRDTIDMLLKLMVKEQFSADGQSILDDDQISEITQKIQVGQIEENMWRKLISKIYDPYDQMKISQLIKNEVKQLANGPDTMQAPGNFKGRKKFASSFNVQ